MDQAAKVTATPKMADHAAKVTATPTMVDEAGKAMASVEGDAVSPNESCVDDDAGSLAISHMSIHICTHVCTHVYTHVYTHSSSYPRYTC